MTSAHHEEVGRRVGAAGAGDSSSSRGPGRSGGGPRGAPWHAPVSRRPERARGNAAAASPGAAKPTRVGASPKRGPPAVAPECRARQPRLPTWKIRGGKKRKAFGRAAGGRKKPLSPLLSNLIWGWGEAIKKKKQARDLFFSSISLVTGSP